METKVKDVITVLSEKAKSAAPHEALHLSQAALNLAHLLQLFAQIKVTS